TSPDSPPTWPPWPPGPPGSGWARACCCCPCTGPGRWPSRPGWSTCWPEAGWCWPSAAATWSASSTPSGSTGPAGAGGWGGSGGVWAFGGGYVEREFDAFGVDRSSRGRLLEEKLGVLRRALAEGVAADGPGGGELPGGPGGGGRPVGPPPPQAGGPPLYLGGTAPKALDRVARLADGWFAL